MRNGNGREVVIVEAVRTPIGRGHPEKGYYKDTHPNELLGKTYTEVIERAGIDAVRGRGRHHRLRPAVRRADVQRRPQRLAAGRAAGRDAGHHRRPPVRLRPAGRQLRRRPDRLRRARRRDRLGRRAHGPHPDGRRASSGSTRSARPWPPELLEHYNLVPQGISAEMIADKWEIPRSELDEIGVRSHQLAHQATEEGRFEREIVPFQVNGDTYVTDQGIRPDTNIETLVAAQAGLQGGRQDHGRQLLADLRRRRRGAADGAREGRRARAQAARADRRPDDRRRRPGDHAHRPDPGHAQAARAQRDEDRRHRPVRDQRGVRLGRSPPGAASSSRTWTA